MRVAVMQPYIFPYPGYFQLIDSVDHFVFYDDVNFVKGGWINRNRILVNGQDTVFTIPLEKQSSFKLINQTFLHPQLYTKWKKKFLKTLQQSYSKAPKFEEIYPMVEEVLREEGSIAEIASRSVQSVVQYLQMDKNFWWSSKHYADSKNLDRADRLIHISKALNADTYINMPGGKDLYDKSYFSEKGIQLFFIQPELKSYDQGGAEFISALSIIDLLMYLSRSQAREYLKFYDLR